MTGSDKSAHAGHDGDVSGLVARIAENAKRMREEADNLTAKIKEFEVLISKLPGKAPCEVVIGEDDGDPIVQCLAIVRNGANWDLVVYERDLPSDRRGQSTLLRDSQVATKIVATQYFEDLLVAMSEMLLKLAAKAKKAADRVDGLTARLQAKEGA